MQIYLVIDLTKKIYNKKIIEVVKNKIIVISWRILRNYIKKIKIVQILKANNKKITLILNQNQINLLYN